MAMSGPGVSVAMSTYNGELFVGEQLESLAKQTRSPVELVVIDDGSTDRTPEIIESFAERAPFPVVFKRNAATVGWQQNFFNALELCSGDLIAFCDQDDVWLEHKLEVCSRWFRLHPDLALLVHAARVVDGQLRPTKWRIPPIRRDRIVPPNAVSVWWVHNGFALVFPRWLRDLTDLRKRPMALQRAGNWSMTHDGWACFMAPAVGPIALVSEELALYRRHGENAYFLMTPGPPMPGPLRRVRQSDADVSIARPPLGGERGLRGLFDIEVKVNGYLQQSDRCRSAAEFLEGVSAAHGGVQEEVLRQRLEARAIVYRRAAKNLADRARAIDGPRLPRRWLRIARLALSGGYGRAKRGGLELPALPLDVFVALAGPSRSSEERPLA